MNPSELQEDDETLISGFATSPLREFTDLRCVVATISRTDKTVKVWPVDEVAVGTGKVWFPWENTTKCELIDG